MSGHSKWSTIKRKKGANDAKRGKIFSKLIKEISVSARQGGGDPDGNPRLRSAIAAAKAENMPKDNIERAIAKGSGGGDGDAYEEILYEGYGPGGVAVLVECMTDNRNRTVADVRHYFAKSNGNLGENGCVAWMFDKKGQILVDKGKISEEELVDKALEAGADDVIEDENEFQVLASVDDFNDVRDSLE
ncbi:MAG: YebC/PmpR family DNA-binding transcriptional regulator, partial [Desulfobulbaceae bacterium]